MADQGGDYRRRGGRRRRRIRGGGCSRVRECTARAIRGRRPGRRRQPRDVPRDRPAEGDCRVRGFTFAPGSTIVPAVSAVAGVVIGSRENPVASGSRPRETGVRSRRTPTAADDHANVNPSRLGFLLSGHAILVGAPPRSLARGGRVSVPEGAGEARRGASRGKRSGWRRGSCRRRPSRTYLVGGRGGYGVELGGLSLRSGEEDLRGRE